MWAELNSLLIVLPLVVGQSIIPPVVLTSRGLLRGRTLQSRNDTSYFGFTRIPYAEPPVGSRRFVTSTPAGGWFGVLDATRDAPMCIQPVNNGSIIGEEDCLYLNVYTPSLRRSALLPVLVWVHGGAFLVGFPGYANSTSYFLDQDIVLVTVTYRLGVLGFLSFEDDIVPGNFGLKDIALAIEWTRREIINFGGDPNLISVFGQSAGSASTHIVCSVPRVATLVKGCISQSGTGDAWWAIKQPGFSRREAFNLANSVGCIGTTTPLRCLQAVRGVDQLANPQLLQSTDLVPVATVIESTTTPGAILTEWPSANRTFPWITGVNQDEGRAITGVLEYNGTEEERNLLINNFDQSVSLWLHLGVRGVEQVARIRQRFFVEGVPPLIAIRNFLTEAAFLYPALKSISTHDGPGFFYVFNYTGGPTGSPSPDPDAPPAVGHDDELPYFFSADFPGFGYIPPGWPRPEDIVLSQTLVRMWVTFAKIQRPTTGNNPNWTEWNNGDYLRIDNAGLRMEVYSNYTEIINFWDSVLGV